MDMFYKWLNVASKDTLEHQVSGMRWILGREREQLGGIIADEMGLGKTTLALGTVVSNFKKRTLIVVPTSIIHQWFTTIKRELGHTAYVHHASIKNDPTRSLQASPIVLTTYGMLAITEKRFNAFKKGELKSLSPLHDIVWDRMLCDEAHNLKYTSTSKFRGAYLTKRAITWLYTGTPIQIRIQEARSLLRLLGYEERIRVAEIDDYLSLNMLRRTRTDINKPMKGIHIINYSLELNTLDDSFIYTSDMTLPFNATTCCVCMAEYKSGDSLTTYDSCSHTLHKSCASSLHSHANMTGAPHECPLCKTAIVEKEGAEKSAYTMFDSYYNSHMGTSLFLDKLNAETHLVPIIRMRQLTTLPSTMSKAVADASKECSCDHASTEPMDKIVEALSKHSKVDAIIDIIKTLTTKTILFTHFRDEVDTYVKLLSDSGYKTAFIDSRVPLSIRAKILDASSPFQVIVMQLRTSCDGLNLKHIHNIIFTSPSYNHGATKQAIARANRIDSQHEVNVYFPHFTATYEEKVLGNFHRYCEEY